MSGREASEMTDYVVDLEELGRASVAQAGGKGALLGELLAKGVPVPRGFCLTTRAYDDFLESSGLMAKVNEIRHIPHGQEPEDAPEAERRHPLHALSVPRTAAQGGGPPVPSL